MSYVDTVLQPGEQVMARATLHWVIYLNGLLVLALALGVHVLAGYARSFLAGTDILAEFVALALAVLGGALMLRAWFRQWGTEIAATNRRVIYKSGVISRRTVEMNMEQVELVQVEQSILGRLLGYGDLRVHGTGEGMEAIRMVADPLGLRSTITAR